MKFTAYRGRTRQQSSLPFLRDVTEARSALLLQPVQPTVGVEGTAASTVDVAPLVSSHFGVAAPGYALDRAA